MYIAFYFEEINFINQNIKGTFIAKIKTRQS